MVGPILAQVMVSPSRRPGTLTIVSLERDILERTRTIVVVGCSRHPNKAAHSVPAAMQGAGYRIVPVNPGADEILGERVYSSLEELPEDVALDLVNVFRPSEEATEVVRRAVDAGAGAIWLQQGIRSAEGRRLAADAGTAFVEDT